MNQTRDLSRIHKDWYAYKSLDNFGFFTLIRLLGIWFRYSTDRIFNVCRIPQPTCDTASLPPPASHLSARTLLVSVHDWFYAVDVVRDDHSPISPRELEVMLHEVVADVARRKRAGEAAVPISVLSADHRDRWTKVRMTFSMHGDVALKALA